MIEILTALVAATAEPPIIAIDRDNVEITQSCVATIVASEGPIIDADGNGVIHIKSDGIEVDFAAQHLHGAKPDQLPDSFAGTGVRVLAKNVTIKNLKVSGYKVGIHATNADGLTVHHSDVSNNFHQRLKSTPQAEDGSDWLWPHHNDDNEWITNYGAGLCVEDSSRVTIHDIKARKTQNGIVLDRVNDSKVYDCDCSFLSGWGLAMWRSNNNVISRNAFDFCVRGYSHGVYNRGQDSAGILMFEQCCENLIAENSATHGGDGIFAFAGREALGETNQHDELNWHQRRGNNNNLFCRNDLSYAAAHGLELTFSFDNHIANNTFRENSICGIWGGYSRDLTIVENEFQGNGEAAYGLERGGINIEHGQANRIARNTFASNRCGVHLWYDNDESLFATPWYRANQSDDHAATLFDNTFTNDLVAIHLRHLKQPVAMLKNTYERVREPVSYEGDIGELADVPDLMSVSEPVAGDRQDLYGQSNPREGRGRFAGRHNIIMTEWGPWDHDSPLLQFDERFDHADRYRLLGTKAKAGTAGPTRMPPVDQVRSEGDVMIDVRDERIIVSPRAEDTLIPYTISCEIDGHLLSARGLLTGGSWEAWTFPSSVDPRSDFVAWRLDGEADHHTLTIDPLRLAFGSGGMTEARGLPVVLPRDHFGTISTRTLAFPPGRWRIETVSDDGIRVWLDKDLVIDDWTHHGPTTHDHEFDVAETRDIELRVEHFELDGYAILSVEFELATP